MGLPILYGENVFRINKYCEEEMTFFLEDIGSKNRALIRHLAVGVPYRPTLALRHRIPVFSQVLCTIHTLQIEFDWYKVHPKKRKENLIEYEPFLKALALTLRIGRKGKSFRNLKRVVSLPGRGTWPFDTLYRVKFVPEHYQVKKGVS
ncbi:hypothetical protein HC762_00665 [bacterium]|nr:hypothetical protein [bacterium]